MSCVTKIIKKTEETSLDLPNILLGIIDLATLESH